MDILPASPSPRIEKYWNRLIKDVVSRRNYKDSHLEFLRVLCDLLSRYDQVNEIIEEEGLFYETESRNGLQRKENPSAKSLREFAAKIKDYSQLFDIRPMKDTENKPKSTGGDWE
jgi:phage terminase small subunit